MELVLLRRIIRRHECAKRVQLILQHVVMERRCNEDAAVEARQCDHDAMCNFSVSSRN